MCALHIGRSLDVITALEVDVPAVDIFIAGFVCIAGPIGQTGETFEGVRQYVEKVRPKLVICENVPGLLKRTRGEAAQIHVARGSRIHFCIHVCGRRIPFAAAAAPA
eukprot:11197841-Lingulodinium_polyedra.AAC.1